MAQQKTGKSKGYNLHCTGWRSLGAFDNYKKIRLVADFELDIPANVEETESVMDMLEKFFDKSRNLLGEG